MMIKIKKQVRLGICVGVLSLIILVSCSKDSVNDDQFVGLMQAKINGKLVVFDNAYGSGFFNLEKSCYENFHEIIGSMEIENEEGHNIYLSVIPSNGVGQYDIWGTYIRWEGPYNEGFNNEGFGYNYQCEEQKGALTITSIENNKYKGTFNLAVFNNECEDRIEITEGSFEIGQESTQDRPCGF